MMNASGIRGMDESKMKKFYMASLRHSEPPTFRPIMILLVVFVGAIIFVGLVITVIAYFPGYSSPSKGGEALRIVGPVILALGGASLIGLIVESAYTRNKQQERNLKELQMLQSGDRLNQDEEGFAINDDDENQMSTMTGNSEPKSILKNKNGSLSTFEQPEADVNYPNVPENNLDESQMSYKIYSVHTLPDPPSELPQETVKKPPPIAPKPDKRRKEKAEMVQNPVRDNYDQQNVTSIAGMGAGMASGGVIGISSPYSNDSYQDARYAPPPIEQQDVYQYEKKQGMSASRPSIETEI